MSKYAHVFFYGGPHAADIAKRKRNALGQSAEVLSVAEAEREEIAIPKVAPNSYHPVSHVVVNDKEWDPKE